MDTISAGRPVVVDNCNHPRTLQAEGVAVLDEKGVMRGTDGSASQGLIKNNSPSVGGADSLLAVIDGVISRLGVDAGENSIIMRRGGKWVAVLYQESKTEFPSNQMRETSNTLAGFDCGSNGNINLAIFVGESGKYLSFDVEGNPIFRSITEMGSDFCENTSIAENTFVPTHTLQCGDGGLRKVAIGQVANPYAILPVPKLIYTGAEGDIAGSYPVDNYQPIVKTSAGSTYYNLMTFDISTMTAYGYTTNAKVAIFLVRLKGTTISRKFDVVMEINGFEWIRISNPASDNGDNDSCMCFVPIPEGNGSKMMTINLIYYLVESGTFGGLVGRAWLVGFMNAV